MSEAPPARITCLLATEVPMAVVLRRGPTDWVQVLRWQTDTGEVLPGDWLEGRIYEGVSDVRPDGAFWVYSAAKGRVGRGGSSWTAIARPPFLYPLAHWPRHTISGGGGSFSGELGAYVSKGQKDNRRETPPPEVMRLRSDSDESKQSSRLTRLGWIEAGSTWTKGDLRMTNDAEGIPAFDDPDLTWADTDLNGRLLEARRGALYCDGVLVADLSANSPAKNDTPNWAKSWTEGLPSRLVAVSEQPIDVPQDEEMGGESP